MPAGPRPESLEELLARAAGGPSAAGVHALLVGRAPRRVLRAARVPGGRRPEPRRLRPPVPALRALRRGPAHEGARAGRERRRRARAWRARSACRTSCASAAPRGHRPHAPTMLVDSRARAGVGLRGDHRRGLPQPSGSSGRRRRSSSRSAARSSRRSRTRWTTSRCCRSGSRGAPRWWPTGPSREEGPAHDRSFIAVAEVDGRGARPRGGKDEEGRRAGGGPARARRARRGGGLVDAPALDRA